VKEMVKKFHSELKQLKKEVIKMGTLARDMLQSSVESLRDLDAKKAEWVLSNKGKIADMDDRIEAKAFQLIALYQPMAKDLREIACILKMITYLARIGRYGKDIANLTNEFVDMKHIKKIVSIPHMSQIVCSMIDDALLSFEKEEVSRFKDFVDREDTVDELRYSIFRECLSYMMENPQVITRCMHYTMVARYLERCGDHACKMAEKIYYMVTGERIEIDCSNYTAKSCLIKRK
jgi:phosphate transport system protein